MAKKKEPEKVWVVVSSEGYIESFPTLLSAQNEAKSYLECHEICDELFIFEVVNSWTVEFPPEPSPQVRPYSLGNLP